MDDQGKISRKNKTGKREKNAGTGAFYGLDTMRNKKTNLFRQAIKSLTRFPSILTLLIVGIAIIQGPAYGDEVDDLIKHLETPTTQVKTMSRLAVIADKRAVKPMFAVLQDEINELIKNKGNGGYSASGAIGNMRNFRYPSPDVVEAIDREVLILVDRLKKSKDIVEKKVLIRTLGRIGSPVASEPLLQLALDPELGGYAAMGLTGMRDLKTINDVKQWALRSKNSKEAYRALYVLTRMRNPYSGRVIEQIIEEHPDPAVRDEARKALEKRTELKEKRGGRQRKSQQKK